MRDRKLYKAQQKVMIVRESLENNTPISQLSEKYEVRPTDIYNWKKKLFEPAADIFIQKCHLLNKNRQNIRRLEIYDPNSKTVTK